MSGQFLRQRHRCDCPTVANLGDVWQCDCGQRWTRVSSGTPIMGGMPPGAHWERRRWPWPRSRRVLDDDRIGELP